VVETLNVNAPPSTTWWYSNRPLTSPSELVRALNECVRFTTSTPNAFGSAIVQWALPFTEAAWVFDAVGIASDASSAASTQRRRTVSPSSCRTAAAGRPAILVAGRPHVLNHGDARLNAADIVAETVSTRRDG
jgi:hypothetical protein